MEFSTEQREEFEQQYIRQREKVKLVLANPEEYGLVLGEKPHIWKMLHEVNTMTREEHIGIIEANYVIFLWTAGSPLAQSAEKLGISENELIEKRCAELREAIERVQMFPTLALLEHGEDLHIWEHLNEWAVKSYEELMEDIEASYVIFEKFHEKQMAQINYPT